MLPESFARILSICPAYNCFPSGSSFCRVLISSSNRCLSSMTKPSREMNTLPASLASLKKEFLDAVRKNDSHRAQLLRQKLIDSSNDRRVLQALGRAMSTLQSASRLSLDNPILACL